MKKKAGVSVYIDLDLKGMVDIIAPFENTTLSEIINKRMEEYIKEHAPLEILDKRISELENELMNLKAEREKIHNSLKVVDFLKQSKELQDAEKEAVKNELNAFRADKYNNPENIRSLTVQIKRKTIDWNTIKENYMFESSIDARNEVLSYLLQLGKIDEHDCKGV